MLEHVDEQAESWTPIFYNARLSSGPCFFPAFLLSSYFSLLFLQKALPSLLLSSEKASMQ